MVAARLRLLFVVVLVATTIVGTLPPVYSPPLARILIDASHLNVHTGSPELEPFFAMLESWTVVPPCHASPVCRWSYEAVIAVAGLNSSILSGVDVYVASMPATPYSAGEVDALVSWFGSGGKSVWLASDSDFTTAGSVDGPIHQNALLEALGSKLRFEPSSVESPTLNIGGTPYSVLTPIINRDTEAAILTQHVRIGFFHGPTILAGYNGGNHVALETTSLENVVWLAKTAVDSVLVDADPTYPPYAHSEGQVGSFVIAAAETIGTNKVVATGEAIFTDYQDMASYPGEKGTPQDNVVLVKNIIGWFGREAIGEPAEPVISSRIALLPASVLVDLSHNNAHASDAELQPLADLLTEMEFATTMARGGLNSSILSGVDVYVASMPATPYSAGEVDALVSWFGSGGKSVWLASDSDFTTAGSVDGPIHQNALLEALGSKLRFEPSSVESPTLNIGGTPYSVLAPTANRDPAAATLTGNVRIGFFHGPTILAGCDSGDYVSLETISLENVVWLTKTTTDSLLVETDSTHPPYAHTEGQHGPFVIAAAETVGTNKIVATGEAIFTDYKSMISYPGEKNTPQDDRQLVINTFGWFAPTLANTALKVTAPAAVIQGEFSTFLAEYTTFGHTAENLTTFETADVPDETLSGSADGTPLDFITVGCDPACAIYTATALGTFSWAVSASAELFKPQTATGILEVVPRQTTTTTTISPSPTPAPLTPMLPAALSLSLPGALFAARHLRRGRKTRPHTK